jgi:hypothetical protein
VDIIDDVLLIAPKSNAAYTINGIYEEYPFSLTSDSTELPDDGLEQSIITYATSYLFLHLEARGMAREWERRYERASNIAIRRQRKRTAEETKVRDPNKEGRILITEPWNSPFVKRW